MPRPNQLPFNRCKSIFFSCEVRLDKGDTITHASIAWSLATSHTSAVCNTMSKDILIIKFYLKSDKYDAGKLIIIIETYLAKIY